MLIFLVYSSCKLGLCSAALLVIEQERLLLYTGVHMTSVFGVSFKEALYQFLPYDKKRSHSYPHSILQDYCLMKWWGGIGVWCGGIMQGLLPLMDISCCLLQKCGVFAPGDGLGRCVNWGDFVGTLTFDGHFLLLVVEVWRFCTRRERVRRHGNTVSHHSLQ